MTYTKPTKPSPAPWRFDSGQYSGNNEVLDASGEVVCCDTPYYPTHVEIPDMVLISAAPEMLEILEKCLKDELNRRKKLLNKSTASCYADERMEKMKDIIAKAKGVEQ